MHQAQQYVNAAIRSVSTGKSLATSPLNATQSGELARRLASDAVSYIYSGALTLGEAVQGAANTRFTWATVKSYYSTFYLCRALLAIKGVCLFYDGARPFILRAVPGETPRKGKDNTHKIVLDEFRKNNIAPTLLSQQIDLEDPLVWLIARREEANYKIPRFVEPGVPRHFAEIDRIGIRRAFGAYVSDSSLLYAFDPDHAILAYPIEMLREAVKRANCPSSNTTLTADDLRIIKALYIDGKGRLTGVDRLLSD